MSPKLPTFKTLQRLIRLCQSQGFIQPIKSRPNTPQMTKYNHGPFGTRLRMHFIKEWWAMIDRDGSVYPARSSTVSCSVRNKNSQQESNEDHSWIEHDHYLSVLSLARRDLPFGIAIQETVMKSDPLRNPATDDGTPATSFEGAIEQTTTKEHKFIYNSHDQEVLCVHYYCAPGQTTQVLDYWRQQKLRWWKSFARTPSNFTSSQCSGPNDQQIVKIQFPFPWGMDTVEVIQNMGQTALLDLQDATGISHQGLEKNNTLCVPDVIQCRCTVEQGIMAFLMDAFSEISGKSQSTKPRLQLHRKLAPYMVAVVTTTQRSRSSVDNLTDHVVKHLRNGGISVLYLPDESPNQSQIERFDQAGIPWCVVIDVKDMKLGEVKLRNRDTRLYEEVHFTHLTEKLKRYLVVADC